ncbi:Biofilm regulator BssS [Mycobacteroides abscessus subsp. massiliense]|uniref:hypothetical protein n=1 Tax=Mycobacteroides abscessus TaxID=36809 RepID=UPI0009D592BF|nr:hypothetical protein [Mycobacteroides abscessus]SLE82896.1 Biofilm regulator BssS [Mycobacteroides abscessus subsp. massiliense]
MTTNTAHKKAIREYQRSHPGTSYPEARRATDKNMAPRVRVGTASGKAVWLDLDAGASVTPVIGCTGSGKTTVLRLIAAELSQSRPDIDVTYVRGRGSTSDRLPVTVVDTYDIAGYVRELAQFRETTDRDRLLVLVVDDVPVLEALVPLLPMLRAVRIHMVLGAQGGGGGADIGEWVNRTAKPRVWQAVLAHAARWVYVAREASTSGTVRNRGYLGSTPVGEKSPVAFDLNDEASHIAARAVLAGAAVRESFAAVGIGLPPAGQHPSRPITPEQAQMGDVAVFTNGYGVVLESGAVVLDGHKAAMHEVACRPDFLGFAASAVRSAAPTHAAIDKSFVQYTSRTGWSRYISLSSSRFGDTQGRYIDSGQIDRSVEVINDEVARRQALMDALENDASSGAGE